jgi:hypothetical protein
MGTFSEELTTEEREKRHVESRLRLRVNQELPLGTRTA